MITVEEIDKQIKKKILAILRKEAKNIVAFVRSDYNQVNVDGKAKVWSELEEELNNVFVLTFFGKGQKALIAEYGKGSKMDRINNPDFEYYINSDIFNKERNLHNFAVMSRPKVGKGKRKEWYYDLDGKRHEKKAKNSVDIENNNTGKYAPIEARHIIYNTVVKQRLGILIDKILDTIATEVAFYKLIDGIKIKAEI